MLMQKMIMNIPVFMLQPAVGKSCMLTTGILHIDCDTAVHALSDCTFEESGQ